MMKEDGNTPSPDELIIEEWVNKVMQPILNEYPEFGLTDLVIEGGVGTGTTMAAIIKKTFPTARFIGMDVTPSYGRLQIANTQDEETLRQILSAQQDGMEIQADCFDTELVKSIIAQTRSQSPILVSFNALYALLHGQNLHQGPFSEQVVGENSPYIGQIHVANKSLDLLKPTNQITSIEEPFITIAQYALANDYRVSHYDHAIVVVKR